MNKTQATLVDPSNLVIGHNYILKHLFGDGVQVEVVSVEGSDVNIKVVRGMMCNQLKGQKWFPGDEMDVKAKASKFYEVQG